MYICCIQYMFLYACDNYVPEKFKFQMRAHLFQARNLIGVDNTGLADPFARVILNNKCLECHKEFETLNPYWDESLVLAEVKIHGERETLANKPPVMLVEIFDWDMFVGFS